MNSMKNKLGIIRGLRYYCDLHYDVISKAVAQPGEITLSDQADIDNFLESILLICAAVVHVQTQDRIDELAEDPDNG